MIYFCLLHLDCKLVEDTFDLDFRIFHTFNKIGP